MNEIGNLRKYNVFDIIKLEAVLLGRARAVTINLSWVAVITVMRLESL
jgi:hypothetical protein